MSDLRCPDGSGRARPILLGALGLPVLLVACATTPAGPPLRVVPHVDLDRYGGLWYEIASYPERCQRGCVATRAAYSRRPDGRIRIVNECREDSFDGKLRRTEGVARVANGSTANSKLDVQFHWPFRSQYWIIELDPDYRYAVVGEPSRQHLRVLSRFPTMPPTLYAELVERAARNGYDPERLRQTPQPPPWMVR